MPKQTASPTLSFRIQCLLWIVGICTSLLVGRLFQLQLVNYRQFRTLSLKNQMTIIPLTAPRGIILDRNGVVLADNIPVYSLELIPEHIPHLKQTLRALQKLIPSISTEDVQLFDKLKQQNRAFVPIALKLKLSPEEVAQFSVNQYRFSGVRIKTESMRYYPLAEETAHVLGYVGRINPDELKSLDPIRYQPNQFIGKAGLERFYETKLHGKTGFEHIETDVTGRTVRTLKRIPPTSGKTLHITLDTRLQHLAYEALGEHNGAVVLMETKTGGILVMVSKPSFNPNQFVGGIRSSDYQALSNTTDKPLFNRAVRGLYPPASTIKPYIALTALNSGVIHPSTSIYDPGWYRLPNVAHVYHDWNRQGHGMVNLQRAITVSCDPYFYNLGHLLGIENMHHALRQFGFGQLTRVDLQEETSGIVPNARWKRRVHHTAWYPGDSLITAIGQGFMLVSPLQMASALSTLAEKGKHRRPHLLHMIQSEKGVKTLQPPILEHIITLHDPQYWHIVHEAMHQVTTSPEGTGYRFGRNPPYSVAAKTGTAQVFGGTAYTRRLHQMLPNQLRDHSLFIAFTPIDAPEVAIAVIVEHDALASHVARVVLDGYQAFYHAQGPLHGHAS